MYKNDKWVSTTDLVKSDIEKINKTIEKCDTKINNLEINSKILSFKKYALETVMNDLYGRSIVFNYYDKYNHSVYGFSS